MSADDPPRVVVCDAGPVIHLDELGYLDVVIRHGPSWHIVSKCLNWQVHFPWNRIIGMNMETIREWRSRQPFEPFVLRMSNGETHEVRHPECVALGKNRIAVSFPDQDRFVHLSLIHVNAIEAAQAAR